MQIYNYDCKGGTCCIISRINDPRSGLLLDVWSSRPWETVTKSKGDCSWSYTKTAAWLVELSCATVTKPVKEAVADTTEIATKNKSHTSLEQQPTASLSMLDSIHGLEHQG